MPRPGSSRKRTLRPVRQRPSHPCRSRAFRSPANGDAWSRTRRPPNPARRRLGEPSGKHGWRQLSGIRMWWPGAILLILSPAILYACLLAFVAIYRGRCMACGTRGLKWVNGVLATIVVQGRRVPDSWCYYRCDRCGVAFKLHRGAWTRVSDQECPLAVRQRPLDIERRLSGNRCRGPLRRGQPRPKVAIELPRPAHPSAEQSGAVAESGAYRVASEASLPGAMSVGSSHSAGICTAASARSRRAADHRSAAAASDSVRRPRPSTRRHSRDVWLSR